MDAIAAMLTRNAQGKLGLPAPDRTVLEQAFACALRAPDHNVLRPWRYLVIEGAALERLAELYVAASLAEKPALEPEKIDKLRKMPCRAPLIVVAITVFHDDPKVPPAEQLLSTGASVQNFMLALHARGFTSMWRTGPLTENAGVRQGLGLAANEQITGFVYVGTPISEPKKIQPLPLADFVTDWKG